MNIFGHNKEGKVPLNEDVIMKCQCGLCPVQAKSECAKPKIMLGIEMKKKMTPEMMKSMTMEQKAAMMPKPEDMPGPYCTIGTAACKDLDRNKACICNTCQVYKDYSLATGKPVEHFVSMAKPCKKLGLTRGPGSPKITYFLARVRKVSVLACPKIFCFLNRS